LLLKRGEKKKIPKTYSTRKKKTDFRKRFLPTNTIVLRNILTIIAMSINQDILL